MERLRGPGGKPRRQIAHGGDLEFLCQPRQIRQMLNLRDCAASHDAEFDASHRDCPFSPQSAAANVPRRMETLDA